MYTLSQFARETCNGIHQNCSRNILHRNSYPLIIPKKTAVGKSQACFSKLTKSILSSFFSYLGRAVYIQHMLQHYVTSRNHYSLIEKTDNNAILATSLIQNRRKKALHCHPELCNGNAGGYQLLVLHGYPSVLLGCRSNKSRRRNYLQHCNKNTCTFKQTFINSKCNILESLFFVFFYWKR